MSISVKLSNNNKNICSLGRDISNSKGDSDSYSNDKS